MNKELYDKVLLLMAIDMGYESDFGYRYVGQKTFDELLKKAGVDNPDLDYIQDRMELMMDKLIEEMSK